MIADIIINLFGRPILWLLRKVRVGWLILGLYFNALSSYNPQTHVTTSHFTLWPLIGGIALYSVGLAAERLEELAQEYKEAQEGATTARSEAAP